MKRIFALASLTAAVVAGIAAPAYAGGLPEGPGNITAPAGFERSYEHQADMVARSCWRTGSAATASQLAFSQYEQVLDGQLAQSGLPASPTYAEFANQPYNGQDLGCPKG